VAHDCTRYPGFGDFRLFSVLRYPRVYEEGKILWRREPIPQYLEKAAVGPDTQDKLKLVLAVREYARDVLKLNVGGELLSYSYVDRPDLSYILTAAPRTELRPYTWWFLIVGRVPYKGYFSKEDADAAAERWKLKAMTRTYDRGSLQHARVVSTTRCFRISCATTKSCLAEVIFHELFHNTVYVKGAGAFNESAANFVGGRSAINFFRDRFGENSPEHQRAIRAWEEELEFSEFRGSHQYLKRSLCAGYPLRGQAADPARKSLVEVRPNGHDGWRIDLRIGP